MTCGLHLDRLLHWLRSDWTCDERARFLQIYKLVKQVLSDQIADKIHFKRNTNISRLLEHVSINQKEKNK